ncbi:hypothetical protein FB45DRAFT_333977 [Roridomyces roridus]|uniref:Zn(2)-C6 fungal-type domain-containing protein n=1 Tax=Roridomyces roridus TaxID=1738132 RepID=A0AAD7B5A4_9AGAR|nr:hypothetical protein FB45DRAFT_333977 [Roridomyces roridus]
MLPSRKIKSCTNCRRRKIKCDGARPTCDQCVLRPPRSMAPCDYIPLHVPHSHETPAQMLATIGRLKERIDELEAQVPDFSKVYLAPPYPASGQGSSGTSSPLDSSSSLDEEPSTEFILDLLDSFFKHFCPSVYFFLDHREFRDSVHSAGSASSSTSAALLNAVCLWGAILSRSEHSDGDIDYTAYFLQSAIHSLPRELSGVGGRPAHARTLALTQAEILLSFYHLREGSCEQGRYRCAAATSLALGTRLHELPARSSAERVEYPAFPLSASSASVGLGEVSSDVGAKAFWAVVILNNYWVLADGGPSLISNHWSDVGTPGFLNPDTPPDLHLLAKSTILFERAVALSSAGFPDPMAFASLDSRLFNFQISLPALDASSSHSSIILLLTHAFTDLAILRLHARYTWTSAESQHNAFAAAHRIAAGIEGVQGGLEDRDPIFAPIYTTLATFLIAERRLLYDHQFNVDFEAPRKLAEVETLLGKVVGALTVLGVL